MPMTATSAGGQRGGVDAAAKHAKLRRENNDHPDKADSQAQPMPRRHAFAEQPAGEHAR